MAKNPFKFSRKTNRQVKKVGTQIIKTTSPALQKGWKESVGTIKGIWTNINQRPDYVERETLRMLGVSK